MNELYFDEESEKIMKEAIGYGGDANYGGTKLMYSGTNCGELSWISWGDGNTTGVVSGNTEARYDFIPVKVIFNAPATICYFIDGSKIVVRCADDEEFIEEVGVMACITKKIFESRNSFKRLIEGAYRQPAKDA